MEMMLVLHAGVAGAIIAGLVTPPLRWYSPIFGGLMAVLVQQVLGLTAAQSAVGMTDGLYVGSVLMILGYGMCVGYITAYLTQTSKTPKHDAEDHADMPMTPSQVARTRVVFKHAA